MFRSAGKRKREKERERDLVDLEGQHAGGEDFFMSQNKKKSKKKGSHMGKKNPTAISEEKKNLHIYGVWKAP